MLNLSRNNLVRGRRMVVSSIQIMQYTKRIIHQFLDQSLLLTRCLCTSSNSSQPANKMRKAHMELTAHQYRDNILASAVVQHICDVSPTVKSVTLKVEDPLFRFKAGQWVDFVIPGIDVVGGYSIYSAPFRLTKERCIDLAVKFAKYPPTYWIHTKCQVGSTVRVRVGGEFYFDADDRQGRNLLLIAGGVGINPLASILQDVVEHQDLGMKVMLMYSAKSMEELLFKNIFDELSQKNEWLTCQYHLTGHRDPSMTVVNGRINHQMLQSACCHLGPDKPLVYICGPPPMISDIEKMLFTLGFRINDIVYEKWW